MRKAEKLKRASIELEEQITHLVTSFMAENGQCNIDIVVNNQLVWISAETEFTIKCKCREATKTHIRTA